MTRTTLGDQVMACAGVLEPLYRLMCDRVRRSAALYADDTSLVLLAPRRTAHAWVYVGSANFTGAGLGAKGEGKRNFELGLCTEDFETVDRVQALFESVWTGVECASCRLRNVCPDPSGEPVRRSLVRLGHARRLGA